MAGSVTLEIVTVDKPDDMNVILGQAHFIKTVEDMHEAMVGSVPRLRFGLAFCEASGARLVRGTGKDESDEGAGRRERARDRSRAQLRPPACRGLPHQRAQSAQGRPRGLPIFCATANSVQVMVAQTDLGRAILGW